METKSLNGGSYKRIIFLMNKIFEKSSSFNPKKFLENSLFKNMHISSKLETLYYLKNTSHNDNDFGVIKTSKSFRDELENFYNELSNKNIQSHSSNLSRINTTIKDLFKLKFYFTCIVTSIFIVDCLHYILSGQSILQWWLFFHCSFKFLLDYLF